MKYRLVCDNLGAIYCTSASYTRERGIHSEPNQTGCVRGNYLSSPEHDLHEYASGIENSSIEPFRI